MLVNADEFVTGPSLIASDNHLCLHKGSTTTATATCAVFYPLSRNPFVYAQFASEVRTRFFPGSEIRHGQQLTSCKYLRAVIDEGDAYPPPLQPGVMWREEPLSTEPLVVNGHIISPGTFVGVGT